MPETIDIAVAGREKLNANWRDYSDYENFYFKRVKSFETERKFEEKKRFSLLQYATFFLFVGFLATFIFLAKGDISGKAIYDDVLSIASINSSSFSFGNFHLGLAGDNGSAISFVSRDTLTSQQGGDSNASSSSYSANVGWLAPSSVAPTIEQVFVQASVSPIEGTYTYVNISFIAFDENGFFDLATSSARVNVTRTTEAVRSASCSLVSSIDGSRNNYSCAVQMWYFDAPGTWNITAYIEDSNGNSAENRTAYFGYNSLTSMQIFPQSLSWPNITSGGANITSSDFTTINNTGNTNLTAVKVKGSDLLGNPDASYLINAENFSASVSTGGNPPLECSGNSLVNATFVTISGASVTVGNLSIGSGNAQEQVYYCLKNVALLKRQSYSTGGVPWIIEVSSLLAAFAIKKKKEDKKKINKKLIGRLDQEIQKKYGISVDELVNFVNEKKEEEAAREEPSEMSLPISIFKSEGMGPAEIIVKYLKENKKLRFSEIARLLRRDDRTIWHEYNLAAKKNKDLNVDKSPIEIPLAIFDERRGSVLESVIFYLRGRGFANIEIARMMGKDPRNVHTIYSRAANKSQNRRQT